MSMSLLAAPSLEERAHESVGNLRSGDLLVQEAKATGEVDAGVGNDGSCNAAAGRESAADCDSRGCTLGRNGVSYRYDGDTE